MNGTIVEIVPGLQKGVIRAQDGSRVLFAASAVQGDFDTLAVGHRVTFDMSRAFPQGSAVRVLRNAEPLIPPGKAGSPPDLRYAGFDHAQNLRRYRFDSVASGRFLRRFFVVVDLTLLRKHQIGVQEVPALCLRKLAASLKESTEAERYELGNDDLLAYAAARAAATQRKRHSAPFARRRSPPPPAEHHPPGRPH